MAVPPGTNHEKKTKRSGYSAVLHATDVHDRMSVILKPDHYDLWLDSKIRNPSFLAECLKPFDPALMKKYPVSTRVNRPENDDQSCAHAVPIPLAQPALF
jgi:putative SOS response-associated peptidase YedK